MAAKQKLLIIDGHALIHRSFHALPPLSNNKGQLVNAVFGFTTTLLKSWKELKPTHIVATFDLKGPTFRDELYKDYKATRVKTPDDLLAQVPMVKEVVKSFNIPIFELAGYEADDLIGTITKQTKGVDNIILTGDMDSMQLVDKRTKVYTMRKGITDTVLYDEAGVEQRYSLRPDQVIDYKALRGDPSDNIPGVKGIGEKTALDLLHTFETLERLYTELADNTKKAQALKAGVREKLIAHKTEAFLSQKLATIKRDVPVRFDLDSAAVKNYDRQKVVTMFQELNFKSLLNKLPDLSTPAAKQAAIALTMSAPPPKRDGQEYVLVNDEVAWKKFFTELKQQSLFAIDTETTGINPWDAKLLGLSFSWQAGRGWYVVAKDEWLEKLRPILEDKKSKKSGTI